MEEVNTLREVQALRSLSPYPNILLLHEVTKNLQNLSNSEVFSMPVLLRKSEIALTFSGSIAADKKNLNISIKITDQIYFKDN